MAARGFLRAKLLLSCFKRNSRVYSINFSSFNLHQKINKNQGEDKNEPPRKIGTRSNQVCYFCSKHCHNISCYKLPRLAITPTLRPFWPEPLFDNYSKLDTKWICAVPEWLTYKFSEMTWNLAQVVRQVSLWAKEVVYMYTFKQLFYWSIFQRYTTILHGLQWHNHLIVHR